MPGLPRALTIVALSSCLATSACSQKEEMTPEQLQQLLQTRLKEADTRLVNNKANDAKVIYQWILEKDPQNSNAFRGLGEVELEKKNIAAAKDFLQKAIQADPKNVSAYNSLGGIFVDEKDFASAATNFAKAHEIDPEDSRIGLKYGNALRETKQFQQAETILRKVSENDPRVQFVFTELGDTLREQGKMDDALRTYMKAQTEYKSDRGARAGAAMVYEAQGKITPAIDEWSQYIRLDCCSHYSENVAKKKLMALQELEKQGG